MLRALRTTYSCGRASDHAHARERLSVHRRGPCSSVTPAIGSRRSTTFAGVGDRHVAQFDEHRERIGPASPRTRPARSTSMNTAVPCADTPTSRIGALPADSDRPLGERQPRDDRQ